MWLASFSIPRITPPLSTTFGERRLETISKPQALGCDTDFVASYASAVCLRLLLGDAKGSDLLDCFANAPLHIIGLRRAWVFAEQLPDLVR